MSEIKFESKGEKLYVVKFPSQFIKPRALQVQGLGENYEE